MTSVRKMSVNLLYFIADGVQGEPAKDVLHKLNCWSSKHEESMAALSCLFLQEF